MELCYLPDMPTVLRALAGAGNAIERWWQQLETAQKHPEGSFKVVNALAMAASYDPDPTQFLGIRLPVTFDTCEVIEERWANWLRQDPDMPYHAKHHLFPSIPFHQLPALHEKIRVRLAHVAPGYLTTNRAIFRSL